MKALKRFMTEVEVQVIIDLLEVFRDLGIAFRAVLILIYILVVAWFKDLT